MSSSDSSCDSKKLNKKPVKNNIDKTPNEMSLECYSDYVLSLHRLLIQRMAYKSINDCHLLYEIIQKQSLSDNLLALSDCDELMKYYIILLRMSTEIISQTHDKDYFELVQKIYTENIFKIDKNELKKMVYDVNYDGNSDDIGSKVFYVMDAYEGQNIECIKGYMREEDHVDELKWVNKYFREKNIEKLPHKN